MDRLVEPDDGAQNVGSDGGGEFELPSDQRCVSGMAAADFGEEALLGEGLPHAAEMGGIGRLARQEAAAGAVDVDLQAGKTTGRHPVERAEQVIGTRREGDVERKAVEAEPHDARNASRAGRVKAGRAFPFARGDRLTTVVDHMSDFVQAGQISAAKEMVERMRANMRQTIKGKDEVVEQVLVCVVAGGHLLIEDLPGVGKTTLAYSLARSMDCDFSRIQFTSDLLPGDVTGVAIYDETVKEFVFRKGRSSPTWCWPMKSTGRRRRRSRLCWK
jgi:hypothetical protein